jgi:hypothetical protein
MTCVAVGYFETKDEGGRTFFRCFNNAEDVFAWFAYMFFCVAVFRIHVGLESLTNLMTNLNKYPEM